MLLMVQKGNRGSMCEVTYRHAKTNDKYMKNYDIDKKNHHTHNI